MKHFLPLLLLALLAVACGDESADETTTPLADGRDATFNDGGKADGLGITEGSAAAAAVLDVANTATLDELDRSASADGVGLDTRAANGIVATRPFATLAELDAVPFVGPKALEALYNYAIASGRLQSDSFVCSYDTPFYYDASSDMARFVTDSVTVDKDTALSSLQARQIFAATSHLGFVSAGEDFSRVWEASDDKDFVISVVDGGVAFDWIKFYAGDTEVGVVFETGTSRIVAEISDGDVLACDVAANPTPVQPGEPVACSYDSTWYFDASSDMGNFVVERATVDQSMALAQVETDQIFAAVVHLGFVATDDAFATVWDVSDDKNFELSTIDVGERFDWVKFYAGDTEVGVVFAANSTTVVAEIGDGDVLGCAVPSPIASCTYDHDWLASSSSELGAFSVGSQELFSTDSLTTLQQEQLVAASSKYCAAGDVFGPAGWWHRQCRRAGLAQGQYQKRPQKPHACTWGLAQ